MRSLSLTFVIALLVSPCVIATPMPPMVKRGNHPGGSGHANPTSPWPNVELQLRGLPESSLDAPVTHGVFAQCGKPSVREAHGDEVNHWRLFFAIGAEQSISFDMVKRGTNDLHGVVGVIGRTYAVSDKGVLFVPMLPSPHMNVRGVLDLLNENGLLRYKYAPSGEGCRCWVKSVVELLKAKGLLHDADDRFPQFEASIGCLWKADGSHTPKPIEPGTFH
jgi:hypothetical protein